jgi:hypothetical protein
MIDRHEQGWQLRHPNLLEERLLRGFKVRGHLLHLQRLEMDPLVIHAHLPSFHRLGQ